MKPTRDVLLSVLIFAMAVTGAAVIWMTPSLVRGQGGDRLWIATALGCTFVALALTAQYQRRRQTPSNK